MKKNRILLACLAVFIGLNFIPATAILFFVLCFSYTSFPLSVAIAITSSAALVSLVSWFTKRSGMNPGTILSCFLVPVGISVICLLPIFGNIPHIITFSAAAFLIIVLGVCLGRWLSGKIKKTALRIVIPAVMALLSGIFIWAACYSPVVIFSEIKGEFFRLDADRTLNDKEVQPYWEAIKKTLDDAFDLYPAESLFAENSRCFFNRQPKSEMFLSSGEMFNGWSFQARMPKDSLYPHISEVYLTYEKTRKDDNGNSQKLFARFWTNNNSEQKISARITYFEGESTYLRTEHLDPEEAAKTVKEWHEADRAE